MNPIFGAPPDVIDPDANSLIFFYTGNASATFDPAITTSRATTIVWQPDDAPATVTSGTSHAYSYVPASGSHRCKATVVGGLSTISDLNAATDVVTSIKNIQKVSNTLDFNADSNSGLILNISGLFPKITGYLSLQNCGAGISGSLAGISRTAKYIRLQGNPSLVGSLSDVPLTALILYLSSDVLITAASIAHIVGARDLKMISMGWLEAGMDIILGSMYSNRGSFTYATPTLQILTGNAAPSGNYAAPPADESENSDWDYDAGVGHHWPLTGNAKRYYLVNGPDRGTADAFNRWTIT